MPLAARSKISGPRLRVAAALVLVALAVSANRAWARRLEAQAVARWRAQLSDAADDGAEALDRWLRDRLGDARVVASYPTAIYLATGAVGEPRPFPAGRGPRAHLSDLLGTVVAARDYSGAWLVGAGGELLASATPEPVDPALVGLAPKERESVTARIDGGRFRVLASAPVRRDGTDRPPAIGTVLLVSDGRRALAGLLPRSAVGSRSGESVLVVRTGDQLAYLSPLRGARTPFSLPLGNPHLAGDAALRGRAAFGEFVDYDGVPVLAAVRPIARTGWGLVSKIDRDEALAEARAQARQATAAICGLFLVVSGVAFAFYRSHADAARLGLARAEARFGHMLDEASDAILFVGPDGHIERVNRRAALVYGYARERLEAMSLHDLYPSGEGDLVAAHLAAVRESRGLVFHATHRAGDGSLLPIEASSRFLESEGVFVTIVRDLRARKAAEARLAFLNRTLRTLSEVNQLMVREPDRDLFLTGVCRILVESGGFRLAWIGVLDPETQWIVPAAFAGHERGFVLEMCRTVDLLDPLASEPAAVAIREQRTVVIPDISADPSTGPWREAAIERALISVIASPIRVPGEAGGCLVLYSNEPGALTPETAQAVGEIAEDVGFALASGRARDAADAAQAALAASNAFLETLVRSASAAIFTVGTDGTVGDIWNPAAERMFGRKREDVAGTSAPFGSEEAAFADLCRRVLSGESVSDLELRKTRRDGLPLDLSLAAAPLRDSVGRVSAILVVAVDVTGRVTAERERRRLETVVARSPLALVITNREGVIEFANDAFSLLTGYPVEELVERTPRVLKSGHHSADFYAGLWGTIASGRVWRGEMRNRRKSGELYWEQATIAPILDEAGLVRHFVAFKEDITARKAAEDELRRTQAALEHSQRLDAVGRLAGGIAHDFNNILGVINGCAEMLVGKASTPEAADAKVRQILEAGRRAAGLTRQLLAFSRRQELNPRVLDLDREVSAVASMLRRLIGETIELALRESPEPVHVRADAGQIAQVLVNLAVNARDAMPSGGRLAIEVAPFTADEEYARINPPAPAGRYARLRVSDDGIGMEAAVRDRCFEPFFTTKPEGAGTGLGLATVYGIVHQSGGHVRVESEPGRGTTFTIDLPRVDEAPTAAPDHAPATAAGAGETILVVEDQEPLRRIVSEMLEDAGYEVLTASDGAEALAVSDGYRGELHVLLTDLVMPGMSGRDLAARIARARPDVAVVLMSGYPKDTSGAAAPPESAILHKPFSRSELLGRIRSALAGRPR